MKLKPSVAIGLGAISGFVGIVALASGAFDDMMPVNRLLGTVLCMLVSLLGLLKLARLWDRPS